MANSHFIKQVIEPVMRDWLAVKHGVPFVERSLPIRWGGQGEGNFKFDAVSEDNTIVACLSTARNLKSGQRYKLMRDATFMWLVPGVKSRTLAVIGSCVADALKAELKKGRLPPATEIEIVVLPPPLLQQLETFQKEAANEVGGWGASEGEAS